MPPRTLRGRSGLVRSAFLWVLICGPSSLGAQELPLERDYPGLGPFACPSPVAFAAPEPEDQAQAGQLASDAIQAQILGEFLRAQDLLARASELDPSSAELAYQHARVLEDLEAREQAMNEYCRALDRGAEDVGILDARSRIDEIYQAVRDQITPGARAAFSDGVVLADGGFYENAVDAFTRALAELPSWGVALYNRAVVLEAMGRINESLNDYRRYLDVTPTDIDPVVARVTERIGALEGMVLQPTPSPAQALALGSVFPGMGHYYTGRGLGGTIVLAAAGAAIATGLLVKRIEIVCPNEPVGGQCQGAPNSETTTRPYMVPAVGAAIAVTLVGAVEAFVRARRRRADAEGVTATSNAVTSGRTDGVGLEGPSLEARSGRVDLSLFAIRFR